MSIQNDTPRLNIFFAVLLVCVPVCGFWASHEIAQAVIRSPETTYTCVQFDKKPHELQCEASGNRHFQRTFYVQGIDL